MSPDEESEICARCKAQSRDNATRKAITYVHEASSGTMNAEHPEINRLQAWLQLHGGWEDAAAACKFANEIHRLEIDAQKADLAAGEDIMKQRTANAAVDAGGLRRGILSLPQELCDQIYDLVFEPDGKEIEITQLYKPPSAMQVDAATRDDYRERYYRQGVSNCIRSKQASAKYLRK